MSGCVSCPGCLRPIDCPPELAGQLTVCPLCQTPAHLPVGTTPSEPGVLPIAEVARSGARFRTDPEGPAGPREQTESGPIHLPVGVSKEQVGEPLADFPFFPQVWEPLLLLGTSVVQLVLGECVSGRC